MSVNKKISEFTTVEAMDNTTQIPIVQGTPLFNAKITPRKFIEDLAEDMKALMNLDKVDNTADLNKPVSNAMQYLIDALNIEVSKRALKTSVSNVNNTSDADKPVSTAQQIALDKKANKVDLNKVDNTRDISKIVSLPTRQAIDDAILQMSDVDIIIPTIGANGNWIINGIDTGILANSQAQPQSDSEVFNI